MAAGTAGAAAVAMRTTVVTSPRVAGAAGAVAVGTSVDVLADDGPYYRRGACMTAGVDSSQRGRIPSPKERVASRYSYDTGKFIKHHLLEGKP